MEAGSKHYIIASDIGGTNSRFRVIQRWKEDPSFRELVFEYVSCIINFKCNYILFLNAELLVEKLGEISFLRELKNNLIK